VSDEERDFDAIWRDIGPTLWRAVLAYSGGRRDVADDAVAEAFARAIERDRQIREPRAYLYRVAFRIAAAELRRDGAAPERDVPLEDEHPSPTSLPRFVGCRRLSAPPCTSTTSRTCRSGSWRA
jgi:DNA-directed RNA polymerase specialized sigma24 family protein